MNATCSPIVASGSLADLGYAEEVCAGKPIVDPQLKVFRRRSTTLALTKDAYDSEEIRSDRMVSDSRHGIRRVGGEIVSEVSPASHDDAYEALMGGFWRAGASMSLLTNAVTINANGVAQLPVAGNWAALGFRVGDRITIAGSGNIDYDGRSFTILGLRADDPRNATLSNEKGFTFQATTLALGTLSVAGKKLGIGNILRSFVFERAFTDIGRFITYRGVRFNSAAFALPPTGIATVNFGLIGTDADPVALASIDGVPEVVKGPAELGTLTFDAATRTVTLSEETDWAAEGFGVGDLVVFTGMAVAPQNNNPRHITAVNGVTITVAEAIQTAVEPAFSVRKVALPDYDEVSEEGVLVAVSGTVIVGGRQIGVVTALDMTINNNMAGSEVVGSNIIPTITWGNQQTVQGSLTILFDADAGLEAYNRFDLEQEALVAMRMDSADGQSFLQITLPRCKFNSGTIGDAVATGLPITMDIRGLQPTDPVADNSQVVIQTAYPGVAAPVVFPAPAPVGAITVSVTGQGTSVAGIVVGGGPADRAYTATVIYRVDTDPENETEVDILPGDTPDDVAANLAAAIDATSDFEAQAENGNSVVITPETGTLISAIRVEIA